MHRCAAVDQLIQADEQERRDTLIEPVEPAIAEPVETGGQLEVPADGAEGERLDSGPVLLAGTQAG